jgi:hypothetical protein
MSLENGEITIEFGRIRAESAASDETAVAVTDRVTLPLNVGHRLLYTLAEALKPHEARLRKVHAMGLSPAQAGQEARPGQISSRPPPDQSGEWAARLLRLVGAWGVPHQYERSFQLRAGGLRSNRFLLSVNVVDIPGDRSDSALKVCGQMGMPEALHSAAAANFSMAKCVHFGFEGDSDSIICKLYLERAVPPEEARRAHANGEGVLLHLAFKWNIIRPEAVTTRYLWHPLLTAEDIAQRLAQLYRDEHRASQEIATEFLRLAAGNAAADTLQYLEVEEIENARRSFDLNVYNTRLQVRDVQHLLQRMRNHFSVRAGQFQGLYDQIKAMSLGHLAGGVHRNGEDFFSVYYGVVGLPRFSSGLRQT